MLRCRDLMRRKVVCCRKQDSISHAAELMAREGVGFLPVSDGSRLVGVVTDRDLTTRALARGLDPRSPVESVMSSEVVACHALDPIERAVELMSTHRKVRLPVVDSEGDCVGVLSLSDLAQAREAAQTGELYGRVSEREVPPGIH